MECPLSEVAPNLTLNNVVFECYCFKLELIVSIDGQIYKIYIFAVTVRKKHDHAIYHSANSMSIEKKISFGDAGFRTQDLLHAKQTLYH